MRRNWMQVLALLMALCVFFSSAAIAENIAGLLDEDEKQEATIAEETPV